MSTKVKKQKPEPESVAPAPFVAPKNWWESDISNPKVLAHTFKQEYGEAESLLDRLKLVDEQENKRQKDIDDANAHLEVLAQELEDRENERRRLWGNRFPLVLGQKPEESAVEAQERLEGRSRKKPGRPSGSKNKSK